MALVRNAIWNLCGQILPLAAAIVVIPLLLRAMGAEGFGLVSIVWTLIGYFSLFDFGLGRALTKFVSMEVGQQNTQALPNLIVTAMVLLAILGITMACLIWLSVPWMVTNVLKPRVSDPAEVVSSFHLVALAIPLVVINVGLRAVLEGLLRFDLTNLIRVPFGLFTIISPAVVSHFGFGLPAIVLAIGGGIFIALLGYTLQLRASILEFDIGSGRVHWSISKKLLSFGGWISVSNFVAPVIFHLDRFIISAILSVAVMAYYVAPYEAVTKTLILSSAIAGSLFPVFAKLPGIDERSHLATMLTGTKVVVALMMPVLLVVACFGFELLEIWVGREVAINGSRPLIFLSVGVFFNAIAYMPYTLLQASGRADLVAKIQLLQVPIYPLILWFSVSNWHLEGAAIIWVARAFFEMSIFFAFTKKMTGVGNVNIGIANYIVCGVIIFALGTLFEGSSLILRIFWVSIALTIFLFILWIRLFSVEERVWIIGKSCLISRRLFGKN
jgi:O-antigen/teichoic acid export membrane protein